MQCGVTSYLMHPAGASILQKLDNEKNVKVPLLTLGCIYVYAKGLDSYLNVPLPALTLADFAFLYSTVFS